MVKNIGKKNSKEKITIMKRMKKRILKNPKSKYCDSCNAWFSNNIHYNTNKHKEVLMSINSNNFEIKPLLSLINELYNFIEKLYSERTYYKRILDEVRCYADKTIQKCNNFIFFAERKQEEFKNLEKSQDAENLDLYKNELIKKCKIINKAFSETNNQESQKFNQNDESFKMRKNQKTSFLIIKSQNKSNLNTNSLKPKNNIKAANIFSRKNNYNIFKEYDMIFGKRLTNLLITIVKYMWKSIDYKIIFEVNKNNKFHGVVKDILKLISLNYTKEKLESFDRKRIEEIISITIKDLEYVKLA